MDLSSIPRRRYSYGDTPIEHLPRLTDCLAGPEIYVKRDDLLGLTAGGNKTRKLEFLMEDAVTRGADTIITTGAVQSNHCRLTLSAAVKEGLKCRLLLEERVDGSYDVNAMGNNFLFKLLGAESIDVVPRGTDVITEMEALAEEVRTEGGHPYIIPSGGSNSIGSLGYAACALEIDRQTLCRGVRLDAIIVPSGSGGTQAGLAAGLHALSSNVPMTGISVGAEKIPQEEKLRRLGQQTLDRWGIAGELPAEKIDVIDDYVGPGYSLPTDEMTEAIQLFARTEGILLDPVYTGKAAAGLIDLIRRGRFTRGQNVLFVHTGGSPALYAYPDAAVREL